MTNNYFAVTTKCGHVGRGKYIIKTFAVEAANGKEAAKLGRWMPRVKHHNKLCILDVKKITYEVYLDLLKVNKDDPYMQCHNIQEQNKKCPEIYDEVYDLYPVEKDYTKARKDRVERKIKLNKIIENEFNKYLRDYDCYSTVIA